MSPFDSPQHFPIRKITLHFLILLQLSVSALCSLTAREFTDIKGRKIEAELTGATLDGKVEIIRKGKKITVPITLFSLDDQAYIRNWIKDNPDAVAYRFNYYIDLKELRDQISKKDGAMINDTITTKPQQILVSITSNNPSSLSDIRVVTDVLVNDVVDVIKGTYVGLAVGQSKKELTKFQRITTESSFALIKPKGRAELKFEFDIESYVDKDCVSVDGTGNDRVLGVRVRIYQGKTLLDDWSRSLSITAKKIKWDAENTGEARNVILSTR